VRGGAEAIEAWAFLSGDDMFPSGQSLGAWWRTVGLCLIATVVGVASTSSSNVHGSKFSVLDYGGVGDGATLNTHAFARAMDAAHASWLASGLPSTLVAPAPGVYFSGQIVMQSGVTLTVATGTRLKASANVTDYPRAAWAFLYSKGATDFGVTGAT